MIFTLSITHDPLFYLTQLKALRMKKQFLSLLSLACINGYTNDTTEIPEGKLIDYPCIFPDITPGAGPRVINGADVFITGDYLYWMAQQDNMQYATTGYSSSSDHSASQGSVKNPHFRYENGFRAGIGFNLGHDAWDTLFNYTWFQSLHNKGSIHSKAAILTPFEIEDNTSFTSAHSLWQIFFNSLDWELGRNFYISKYLSLRPFFGLKGTFQKQKFHNSYEKKIHSHDFVYKNQLKNSFWGVGVRSGLNTLWHFSGSWSLFGDLGLSGVWGQFNTQRQDSHQLGSHPEITPIYEKNHDNTLTPVLELGLGIRKDAWFEQDRFHVNIQVGWEEQVWWNQNKFSLDRSMPRDGNLFLQGLTARIRCDF